jgi:hypothetical protein
LTAETAKIQHCRLISYIRRPARLICRWLPRSVKLEDSGQ